MYQKKSYRLLIVSCCLVFVCMALSAFFVYFPLTDTDIFWHLAAGREMVLQKHILHNDPFAYSLPAAQWIDLHWLFQLIVYGLYTLGSEKTLIVFKLIAVALTAGLLCTIHRSLRYIIVTSFIAALLLYETRYLICLRPVLISMVCMAIYLFLFENVRRGLNRQWLWLCVPLQLLWTNCQGLYMIGLFIIAAYWCEAVFDYCVAHYFQKTVELNCRIEEADQKKGKKASSWPLVLFLTLVFSISIAACLVNPYGFKGFLLPLALFGRITPDSRNIFSMNIAENVPLFSLSGYDAVYRTIVIIIVLIACILFFLNRRKSPIAHLVLFAGFAFLAYSAERNILLFIIVMIPILGYHIAGCDFVDRFFFVQGKMRRRWSLSLSISALIILLAAIVQHSLVVSIYPPNRTLSPFRFPEKICEDLKQNLIPGRMFNDVRYGGYLIWQLYPLKQVYIDGRLILRTPEFFRDYLSICKDPETFPQVADKFNITFVILPSAIFDLHHKLIRWLYESDDWRLEYTDGASVLFVKNSVSRKPALKLHDQIVNDVILDSISLQWKDAPYVRREAMFHFSEMLDNLGLENAAKMVKIRIRDWEKQ